MSLDMPHAAIVERLGLITKRFNADKYRVSVAGKGLMDAVLHEKLRGAEPRIGVGDTVRLELPVDPESLACIVEREASAASSMLAFMDSTMSG